MKYVFTAPVLQTGTPNRAGRLYPRETVEKAIKKADGAMVPVVSEIAEWGSSMIPLDKMVGEVDRMWLGEDGVLWVQGYFFSNAAPLAALDEKMAVRLIGRFKLVPIGHGAVGSENEILPGYRINGFLIAEESNDEKAGFIPAAVVPDGV